MSLPAIKSLLGVWNRRNCSVATLFCKGVYLRSLNSVFFYRLMIFAVFLIVFLPSRPGFGERFDVSDEGFYAYYTKVDSGQDFEKYSRTGKYADIVVSLSEPAGKLIFWRGSSYLPYWETSKGRWYVDEIIPRSGDGSGMMPDRVNSFSRVKLIECSPEKIVVHWRYEPQFGISEFPVRHREVDAREFVDEYFTVLRDGKVIRTIKRGSEKIDDWKDPLNKTRQTFRLRADGITNEKTKKSRLSQSRVAAVSGNPIQGAAVVEPAASWQFDEGKGDFTKEQKSGHNCLIAGHKSLWKKGVSGTCLQFDGYNSLVSLAYEKAPKIKDALTLEGWLALAAYPWNRAPIVQQGDDEGYFLGVNAYGRPGFGLQIGNEWKELICESRLERNRWYHIVGTFDNDSGLMKIYINGEQAGSLEVAGSSVSTCRDEIRIAAPGAKRRPTDGVRKETFESFYTLDGLLDEVRIYDSALTAGQVKACYNAFYPGRAVCENPDMQTRSLPKPASTGRFQARYTHLRYYESWDNMWRFGEHADVVVDFDKLPVHFVFWRGTCYIPMLVNEKGQWYSNEFNETWFRTGGKGCMEPMSDKESYHNHTRIIENSPARVVVHWRYPLIDVFHVYADYKASTGWGEWSDWYYTIYPDGVAVKRMRCWSAEGEHEWQESMAILGPGRHPEEVLETQATLTLADIDGNTSVYGWADGRPSVDYTNQKIQVINYKAQYDAFTIAGFTGGNVISDIRPYAAFPCWNHWPVALILSDGRYANFPDRVSHSSLNHVRFGDYRKHRDGPAPYQERILMEGMTNKAPSELVPLAKSWLQPAEIIVRSGCRSTGYDKSQRAYVLSATEKSVSFGIKASQDSPIVNPCFVINNWDCNGKAELKINGKKQTTGAKFRQGIIRDTKGRTAMVIWLEYESNEPVDFVIDGADPKK